MAVPTVSMHGWATYVGAKVLEEGESGDGTLIIAHGRPELT